MIFNCAHFATVPSERKQNPSCPGGVPCLVKREEKGRKCEQEDMPTVYECRKIRVHSPTRVQREAGIGREWC
jgi:hypothetical protein